MPESIALHIGDPIAWRKHQIEILRGKVCYGGLISEW